MHAELKSPVFVVGPGRCGTTTVARYLIDKGYDFGGIKYAPRWLNHEDRVVAELNSACLAKHITRGQWTDRLKRHLRTRRAPWGFKVCNLCHNLPETKALFPDALWIWPKREFSEMLDSWMRAWDLGEDKSAALITQRELMLRAYLPDALVVPFERIVDGTFGSLIDETIGR
jgi:hypothetical protein